MNIGFIYGRNNKGQYLSTKAIRESEYKFFGLSPYSVRHDHCFYTDFGFESRLNSKWSMELALRFMVRTNPYFFNNKPHYDFVYIPTPAVTFKRSLIRKKVNQTGID